MRDPRRRGERGTTLLEAMVATVIVMVGFLGVLATNKISVWMTGNARSVTRATAIASDLAEQINLWSYDDPRLADGVHPEAHLTLGSATWSGIPAAVLEDGVPFTRTWTVTRVDNLDGDTVPDGARITIDVSSGNGGRNGVSSAVTLYTYKRNPAER